MWMVLAARGLMVVAAVVAGSLGVSARTSEPFTAGKVLHPPRVAVMVLENRSFEQVIGSRHAPFLNRLARRYGLATRYFATGHPSLPNYMALTTGGTAGVRGNCSRCGSDLPSFVNQLDAAGRSWRAYFESLPRDADKPVTPSGRYNKHYNPFVYTESVNGNRGDRSRVVGFAGLRRDLARRKLPAFTWIAPNVRHDGHHHSLRAADAFAARTVPGVLRALGPHGLLYLTWDEGVRSDHRGAHGQRGGGHIALIAAGGAARRHVRLGVVANHYALLRTLEANFGLPPLGQAGAPSTPLLSGLVKRSQASTPAR
jgi:hypothetical protein